MPFYYQDQEKIKNNLFQTKCKQRGIPTGEVIMEYPGEDGNQYFAVHDKKTIKYYEGEFSDDILPIVEPFKVTNVSSLQLVVQAGLVLLDELIESEEFMEHLGNSLNTKRSKRILSGMESIKEVAKSEGVTSETIKANYEETIQFLIRTLRLTKEIFEENKVLKNKVKELRDSLEQVNTEVDMVQEQPIEEEILEKYLEDMRLSKASKRILEANGLVMVGEVVDIGMPGLEAIKGMGVIYRKEIQAEFMKLGIILKGSGPIPKSMLCLMKWTETTGWEMQVDNKKILVQDRSTVTYFEEHYKKLGYKVVVDI